MKEGSIGRVLRSYAEICDGLNHGFIDILFFGAIVFTVYLLLKNPDNIGYLFLYGVLATVLILSKATTDSYLKRKYLSKKHIWLNEGGWEKEADKAFRAGFWPIFFSLVSGWYKGLRRDKNDQKKKGG
jgi:hypothetical protein